MKMVDHQLQMLISPSPTVSWISSELLSRSPSDVTKDSAVLRSVSTAVWCPVIWPWRACGPINKKESEYTSSVYIYTVLYRLWISPVWWTEDKNNSDDVHDCLDNIYGNTESFHRYKCSVCLDRYTNRKASDSLQWFVTKAKSAVFPGWPTGASYLGISAL